MIFFLKKICAIVSCFPFSPCINPFCNGFYPFLPPKKKEYGRGFVGILYKYKLSGL